MAIELNRDSFEGEVLTSNELVLIDFWGPQCKPCLALMPSVERIEKEYSGRLKVAKVNAAENRMLCAKLRVMGLPTFLFYKGGEEVKRLTGETITGGQLIESINALLVLDRDREIKKEGREKKDGVKREEGHCDWRA